MNEHIALLQKYNYPASRADQVIEAAEQIDSVAYFNPPFDPLITIAVVRMKDDEDPRFGCLRISDSRPEVDADFDAEYGRARALHTALWRWVMR